MSPASSNSQAAGKAAEDRALAYLEKQGLILLERNYRSPRGEIDLVVEDGDTLVFVEVRYRNNARFGGPLASVDWRKQQKLTACAHHYLAHHPSNRPVRFDVVALDGSKQPQWIRDAFQVPP